MADPRAVIEGSLKVRDGRKWKSRWCVVSKLSPVADCLHVQLYRDSKERCKNNPTKASLALEAVLAVESGFTLDKESHTLALLCRHLAVVLAFDCRELLLQWQLKIRANLSIEDHQFLVQVSHVPPKSKIACGPANLHLQDYQFTLTSGVPPRLLGLWPLKELRRFGSVDGKFCFEGGSKCGKGEGLHVLLSIQHEEIAQAFELASKGNLIGNRRVLSRKNSVMESSSCSSPLRTKAESVCEACAADSRSEESGGEPCGWPRDGDVSRATLRSLESSAGLVCDGRTAWSLSHCSKCGRHYCRRLADRQGGIYWRHSVCSQATSQYSVPPSRPPEACYDRPRPLAPIQECPCRTLPRNWPVPELTSPAAPPCTCSTGPFANYDVPKSAVPCSVPDPPESKIQSFNEMYDIPKSLKENLQCPCTGEDEAMCTCQRVMVWAGQCRDQTGALNDLNKHTKSVGPPPLPPRTFKPPHSTPNYINLNFEPLRPPTNEENKSIQPNYENLHFIDTLPIYENSEALLQNLQAKDDSKTVETNPQSSNLPEDVYNRGLLLKSSSNCFKCPVCLYMNCNDEDRHSKSSNDGEDINTYELMSYELKKGKCEEGGENYLVMYPVHSNKIASSNSGEETQRNIRKENDKNFKEEYTNIANKDASKEEAILPLRPFMPLLLPFQERQAPNSLQLNKIHKEINSRNARSNSLGDIKKKVFTKSRSSSVGCREENEKNSSEKISSPKHTPSRKQSFLSRITLRSKEKSFSTDEISPPSSLPTSPNTVFIEDLHRYAFHKSADCLQAKEEMRLSEDDLSQDHSRQFLEEEMLSNIKRSTSIPFKESVHARTTLCSNSSDSRSLPRNSKSKNQNQMGYYSPFPRREDSGQPYNPKIVEHMVPSRVPYSYECKACQAVTSPEAFHLQDNKSTTSSSSSDMSDYIESLSLCSRSSSGSEYARSATCALRPRSGREYRPAARNSPSPGYGSSSGTSSPTKHFLYSAKEHPS